MRVCVLSEPAANAAEADRPAAYGVGKGIFYPAGAAGQGGRGKGGDAVVERDGRQEHRTVVKGDGPGRRAAGGDDRGGEDDGLAGHGRVAARRDKRCQSVSDKPLAPYSGLIGHTLSDCPIRGV